MAESFDCVTCNAYCGHIPLNDTISTCTLPCKACPWGWRSNGSIDSCYLCREEASIRDYQYFLFAALLAVTLHWMIIAVERAEWLSNDVKGWTSVVLGIFSFGESVAASVFTLLVFPPLGSFTVYVCPVDGALDFYPIFWSSIGEDDGFVEHCSSEAAYPRITLVLVFFGFRLLLLITVHLLCSIVLRWKKHVTNNSLCLSLILLPCLAILFVAASGALYYSLEYVSFVVGCAGIAVESMYLQWRFSTLNPFRLCSSSIHWFAVLLSICFMTFGVLGLNAFDSISDRAKLIPLALVPVILHPLFSLCVFTHPYPRVWHMKRRARGSNEVRRASLRTGRGRLPFHLGSNSIQESGTSTSDAFLY